jgi:hypothetical protein
MVHHKLPDKLANPGPLLGVMRTCRLAMIGACSQVKPMCATYHGLTMVIAAIDAFASLLMGRNDYFWAKGGGVTADERKQIADDAKLEADKASATTTDTTADGDEPTPAPYDRTTDAIIADCDGDPRAAVAELLAIIRSLIHENQTLREAASPGFARRRPIVFGSPQ